MHIITKSAVSYIKNFYVSFGIFNNFEYISLIHFSFLSFSTQISAFFFSSQLNEIEMTFLKISPDNINWFIAEDKLSLDGCFSIAVNIPLLFNNFAKTPKQKLVVFSSDLTASSKGINFSGSLEIS